jgi:hypothetical protein
MSAARRVAAECREGVGGQVLRQWTEVQQQHLTDHLGQPVGVAAVAPAGQHFADLVDGVVDAIGTEDPASQGRTDEGAEPFEGRELAEQVGVDDDVRPGVGADLAAPGTPQLGAAGVDQVRPVLGRPAAVVGVSARCRPTGSRSGT